MACMIVCLGPCHLPFTLSVPLRAQGGGMLTGYLKKKSYSGKHPIHLNSLIVKWFKTQNEFDLSGESKL